LQEVRDLRSSLAVLEPSSFSVDRAAELVEALAALENACGAARVRLAAWAAAGGAHRDRGFAAVSEWLANAGGGSVRDARRDLETMSSVDECPDTRRALANGEVSLAQTDEIVRTVAEVPGTERELLDVARNGNLRTVREVATERRLAAIKPEELHSRQHRAREFSHWRDRMGMIRGSFALPPDVGIPIANRLDRETDRLRRAEIRRHNGIEPRAALAADALAAALQPRRGDATSSPRGAGIVGIVVIDWPALARGHTHAGERCHIVGGGPIPVAIARELTENAFVKAVLTDGVEVQRVLHLGRRIPAELRTALELGPPPALAGVTCSEEGCERRYGLEWDHREPFAEGGLTSYDNLDPLCRPHHREKTRGEEERRSRGP
jgi:hypothetical protein